MAKKIEAPTKKARADWDAVERDYRTGKFTLRELEAKHGPNNASISRKAARSGWTQDLSAAIKQATNTKLIESLVVAECSKGQQKTADTVLAAAELNKDVILSHRHGLKRITGIKALLLDQIEQAAENMQSLAEVIEMVRNPDDNGMDRANDALKKAMSRSTLVDDLKKLADVDEKVRKGEREAFDIGTTEEDAAMADASRYTDTERAVRLAALMAKAKAR
jgi:hypothetical protein